MIIIVFKWKNTKAKTGKLDKFEALSIFQIQNSMRMVNITKWRGQMHDFCYVKLGTADVSPS